MTTSAFKKERRLQYSKTGERLLVPFKKISIELDPNFIRECVRCSFTKKEQNKSRQSLHRLELALNRIRHTMSVCRLAEERLLAVIKDAEEKMMDITT